MLAINFNSAPKTVKRIKVTEAPSVYVWRPRKLETILFYDEDANIFKVGLFLDLWNNLRNLRSADDNRIGKHYEASPIHNEVDSDGLPVIRARVIDIATGYGIWADIGYILEHNTPNIEAVHEQNRLLKAKLNAEMTSAFGEVEAVA